MIKLVYFKNKAYLLSGKKYTFSFDHHIFHFYDIIQGVRKNRPGSQAYISSNVRHSNMKFGENITQQMYLGDFKFL